jgi:flagellar hook-length control protein FliK
MVSAVIPGLGFFDGNEKSTTVQDKSQTVNFHKVMTQSLSQSARSTTDTKKTQAAVTKSQPASTGKTNASNASNSTKSSNSSNTAATQNTSERQINTQKADQTDKNSNVNETKNTNTDVKDSAMNDEASEKLEELGKSIKDKIAKLLGVTDDDINSTMAMLGMTMADLFSPVGITKLITEMSGSQDTIALLTDENLSNGLKEILDFMNQGLSDIAEQFDLSQGQMESFVKDFAPTLEDTKNSLGQVPLKEAELPENVNDSVALKENAPVNEEPVTSNAESSDDESTGADLLLKKMTVETEGKLQNGENTSSQEQNMNQGESPKTQPTLSDVSSTLYQNIQNAFEATFSQTVQSVDAANVVRQIIDSVKLVNTQQLQSMEIQLTPENLGKVNVNVSAKNGVITAQITTQNEEVKRAIETQMSTLKETFANQGIKIDAVEVTVQSHSFEAGQNLGDNASGNEKQSKNVRKHLNMDSLNDLDDDDLSEDEIRVRKLLANDNSSVEYSA